jgi:hypothetical protein
VIRVSFCDVAEVALIHKYNLAKFGYKQDMKVGKFKHPSHFWLHARFQ